MSASTPGHAPYYYVPAPSRHPVMMSIGLFFVVFGAGPIGALLIGVLNNGLNLLGVSSFYQQVIKGAVILLAVLLDRRHK